METYVVNVKEVKFSEKFNSVELVFAEQIKGCVKQDDGSYAVVDTVNKISFPANVLTAKLCNVNEDIAVYCGMSDKFGKAQYVLLLMGAKLHLNREFHAAGEVVGEVAIDRNKYYTDIVKVELHRRAQAALDKKFVLD